MANTCCFTLVVRGPAADLADFTTAVLRDSEPRPKDSECPEMYIVHLTPETWGREGQESLLLTGIETYRCHPVLAGARSVCDQVVLIGECKWCSPAGFVKRAVEIFPTLSFDLQGTTEYETYEHWRSCIQERRLELCECRITRPEDNTVVFLEIHGQVILDDRGRSAEARDAHCQGDGY